MTVHVNPHVGHRMSEASARRLNVNDGCTTSSTGATITSFNSPVRSNMKMTSHHSSSSTTTTSRTSINSSIYSGSSFTSRSSSFSFRNPPNSTIHSITSSDDAVISSMTNFRSEEQHQRVVEQLLSSRELRLKTAAKTSQHLTMNKLRFSRLKKQLVGRDTEMNILRKRLKALTTTAATSDDNHHAADEFILIKGISGSGKSVLASKLNDMMMENHQRLLRTSSTDRGGCDGENVFHQTSPGRGRGGIYACGKIDQQVGDDPYSTIIVICEEICSKLFDFLEEREEDFEETTTVNHEGTSSKGQLRTQHLIEPQTICNKLSSEIVGMEAQLLVNLIPLLNEVIDFGGSQQQSEEKEEGGGRNIRPSSLPSSQEEDQNNIKYQMNLTNRDLLENAIRKFLRIVSQYYSPLVIVFDDLQWADVGTIEMIKSLLLNRDNSSYKQRDNMMVVGCYRSDEVDDTSILSKTLRDIQLQENDSLFETTIVELGNLGVAETNQILMTLLSVDEWYTTQQLAELCHKRTLGNAFFLLSFIKMLEEQDLLKFNLGTFKWTWNCIEIEKQTVSTTNVVDLVKDKMNRSTSTEMIDILKLASCLGNGFDKSTLRLLWTKLDHSATDDEYDGNNRPQSQHAEYDDDEFGSETEAMFEEMLNKAVEENFLECLPDDSYQWVHDRVQGKAIKDTLLQERSPAFANAHPAAFCTLFGHVCSTSCTPRFGSYLEAAMSLESNEENAIRQHLVGTTLYRNLVDKALEESVFVVVNLLNKGTAKSLDLAALNLRAAKRAKAFSAFNSQAKYAAIAISNLPKDCCWECHKDLTLDVYSIAAEAAGCLGDFELMEGYCQEVLKRTNVTIHEKLRCYHVFINCLGRIRRPKEAIDLALDVCEELGFHFPRNVTSQTFAAITNLVRLKRKLKTSNILEIADVQEMSLMMDPDKQEAMGLLQIVTFYAYMAKEKMIWLLASIRMVQMTIEYGLTEDSPTAFGSCAIVITHVLGLWKAGKHFGALSRSMAARVENDFNKQYSAMAWLIHNYVVLSWSHPLQYQVRHLIEGYKRCMDVGNTNIAVHNIFGMICIVFISGKLATLEEDARIYLPQIKALHGNENMAAFITIMWQAASNLMNPDGNTTVLTGIAMDESELVSHVKTDSEAVFYRSVKNRLLLYFEEYEAAAKLALERGDEYVKGFMGTPMGSTDVFVRGMALYAMARECLHRRRPYLWIKYRRHANRARSTVRSFVMNGNPNAVHYLKLLDAEHLSCSFISQGRNNNRNIKKKHIEQVSKLYTEAVKMSVRGGFIQDAALAKERYANYILDFYRREEKVHAISVLQESCELYKEWGAQHKVQMLRAKIIRETSSLMMVEMDNR